MSPEAVPLSPDSSANCWASPIRSAAPTAACSVADHLWLMGHAPGEDGKTLPGSRIVKQYNLIDRDLCWQPNIITTARFTDFVREVKEEFRRL